MMGWIWHVRALGDMDESVSQIDPYIVEGGGGSI